VNFRFESAVIFANSRTLIKRAPTVYAERESDIENREPNAVVYEYDEYEASDEKALQDEDGGKEEEHLSYSINGQVYGNE
jgi:hypothetical protein